MAFPDSWPYRKKISIQTDSLDASQSDFPLCVPLASDSMIGGRCLSTGYDIRFSDADGTEIHYERESFAVSAGAATGVFWVKCDPSTAGTDIYLYYGNPEATDGNNPTAVWDSNYAAVYHMNDATTSTILDSTSNDIDGAKKGASEPAEATGKIALGQGFAGDNDYINIHKTGFMETSTPYTLEAWFNLDSAETDQYIIAKDKVTTNVQYAMGWSGGAYSFLHATADEVAVGLAYSAFNIGTIDSNWHHVAHVWNDTDGKMYIHADGANVANKAAATGFAYTDANRNSIGRFGGYNGQYFTGLVDEVRFSTIARSTEWLKFEYYNMASSDNELTWGDEEQLYRVRRPHGKLNRPRR